MLCDFTFVILVYYLTICVYKVLQTCYKPKLEKDKSCSIKSITLINLLRLLGFTNILMYFCINSQNSTRLKSFNYGVTGIPRILGKQISQIRDQSYLNQCSKFLIPFSLLRDFSKKLHYKSEMYF